MNVPQEDRYPLAIFAIIFPVIFLAPQLGAWLYAVAGVALVVTLAMWARR